MIHDLIKQLVDLLDDERLCADIAYIRGLSCQEHEFLAHTARFWGLPTGAYIQLLVRNGGNPLIPARPKA